ncbi:MAG: YbhB/YbcL family Raf kinase inhibitor-like protein [Deltaproteobacteria bacterium]|nr:YbhB/YbcL family Raf kinase inhibitor-like protein [Deltaproteobacteria bacterium]
MGLAVEGVGVRAMAVRLYVPALANGRFPVRHTADGLDLSPSLEVLELPDRAEALAFYMVDPDAPGGLFTHWLAFDLPATRHRLMEGTPRSRFGADGLRQAKNDFGWLGYGGPNPPLRETHRYELVALALCGPTKLGADASLGDLLRVVRGIELARAEVTATYGRD